MSICFAITDVDWAVTKEVASALGSVGTVFGVAVAAYFGRQGLATWRNQIKGAGDHELARRTLIELYRYRDAVDQVRSPVIWTSETIPDDHENPHLDPNIERFNETRRAYTRRLREVRNVRAPLSVALLEIEAVWGGKFKELLKPIFDLQNELEMYIRVFLNTQNPQLSDDYRASYDKILSKKRDVLYSDTDDEVDFFRSEFNSALFVIEKYLKSKLIR